MGRTRGTQNSKGMWAAGVALAALLAFTGYAVLSGSDEGTDTPGKGGSSASASASSGPSATYALPDDWTEPDRWAALPRGQRTDAYGSRVGFPQSAEGAVAMMVAANTTDVEGERSITDNQVRIYHSYMGRADQSDENAERIELKALESDKRLATRMGLEPGQALPSGAYVRNSVVGFKIIGQSDDEVSAWILARAVQKNGETEKESVGYSRTLAAVQWEEGDWKLTAASTLRAQQAIRGQSKPKIVAPGDKDFNDAGWTAIREAS